MVDRSDVTRMLSELQGGDREVLDRLLPAVYEELRTLARNALRNERTDHTLGATAMVHEAYLKLVELDHIDWSGRAHFFGAAAMAMRRILVDYARARSAGKRGGGAQHVPIEDVVAAATERPGDLLALDQALERLGALSERQARVVECRFFAGMEVEETAIALGISNVTVRRDWAMARAWLNRELSE